MIFAQIKNGIVQNTIVLEDESLSEVFQNGFDHLIRVDQLEPRPSIGWSYDAEADEFAKPEPVAE